MTSTRVSLPLDPEAPLPLDTPMSEAIRASILLCQLYLDPLPPIPPASNQPPLKINFFLPVDMLNWLDEQCASLQITRQEFIRRALHYARPYWFQPAST